MADVASTVQGWPTSGSVILSTALPSLGIFYFSSETLRSIQE
jgi:hypothetical protein